MADRVIIDGNNLLYAMHELAPLPNVGRETLVKIIERWARLGDDEVVLVFDGPVPRGGLSKQMSSARITVRFSEKSTADDIIVELIHAAKKPDRVRVVTGDTAIRREARYRRCRYDDTRSFVAELFSGPGEAPPQRSTRGEKPDRITPEQAREWLDTFGYDDADTDAFDGHDAMNG